MMYCLSDHFRWVSHMMVQFPVGAGKVYAQGANAHLIYNNGRSPTMTHTFPMRPELAREMGPLGAIDVRVDEADNRLAISFFAITLRREVAIHL
jgi:hypothetical protein